MTDITPAERHALSDAIDRALAAQQTHGKTGIAATILQGSRTLATGENEVHLQNDPTRHAEMVAIARAGHALGTPDLSGCTLISSLQPCEMCLAALRFAGITRVIFAATKARVAAKYFIFPGLDLAAFHAASPTAFETFGGIDADRVLPLYRDGAA
ncbi:deaminase [Gemmobacter aquarius]|uniref:Deaminase n=1 Tax=Paragemmobacter aquarius TaxID=2169400 RepID=A0A2S0UMG9_9RHOB|nr:nucleoside deaminase [Gemmobacter aquarius]AWB48996.1 deaminase [Gemmobacter aquarius]